MGGQRHCVQIVSMRQFSYAFVVLAFHFNAVLCWSCVQLFQQIIYVDIEQECRQWVPLPDPEGDGEVGRCMVRKAYAVQSPPGSK